MADVLPSLEAPDLDLDRLKEEIRQEVAALRASGRRFFPDETGDSTPAVVTRRRGFDASSSRSLISLAGSFADIGLQVPPMHSFRGVIRRVARLSARIVLTLSRFITDRQGNFNHSTVRSLNNLADGLERTTADLARDFAFTLQQVHGLQELSKRQAERIAALEAALAGGGAIRPTAPPDDRAYQALGNAFRSGREELREAFRVYLPWIQRAGAGVPEAPILDLGCGRGEWLSLLADEGLKARGVDQNTLFLEECHSRNLEVSFADAIAYLHDVADDALGAVTAFHLVEHLEFADLNELLTEARRALRPGGLLILETPNPENLLVGSCNFYTDPTHRKPLPPVLLRFLVERAGFQGIEILNLHPFPEEYRWTGSEMAEWLSDHFFGPQDYAVVGFR